MKLLRLFTLWILVSISLGCTYHVYKGMPDGTNYESEYYYVNENEIDFLYDLTYRSAE